MTENNDNAKPKTAIFYAKNTVATKSTCFEKNNNNKNWQDKSKRNNLKSNENFKNSFKKVRTKEESSDRIETFKPKMKPAYHKAEFSRESNKNTPREGFDSSSPWKKKVGNMEQTPTFGFDDKLQRNKNETWIYSDNACRSIFKHRPEAIVKLFITQEMTYPFKDLIKWLVDHHLGYDIVDNAQLTKITQTPHHGGICLIVKKTKPLQVLNYLEQFSSKNQDCVLAIDDINNPHNLGGLMRSAAFFDVSGIMLRDPSLLDSGAAMRVSEGGIEALTTIKSDDFLASLDLFKQKDYQIVALLPCQIKSVKSIELQKVNFNQKVVFIIFQQINMKLINCADKVVYLQGNENMAALNISVATGILLAHRKNHL